jgi:hypothetical protein
VGWQLLARGRLAVSHRRGAGAGFDRELSRVTCRPGGINDAGPARAKFAKATVTFITVLLATLSPLASRCTATSIVVFCLFLLVCEVVN